VRWEHHRSGHACTNQSSSAYACAIANRRRERQRANNAGGLPDDADSPVTGENAEGVHIGL